MVQIALKFDRPADQRDWDSAKVYVKGYRGNPNFVLFTEAKQSPAILLFEQTGEKISIAASSRNIEGEHQDYKKLVTTGVTL